MSEDEITALAREYAEWVTDVPKADELPDCLLNEANKLIASGAERVLTWLLTRYCLIKKEAVRNAYKAALHSFNNASDPVMTTMEFHNGEMSAIESLFPEIAKEVEG